MESPRQWDSFEDLKIQSVRLQTFGGWNIPFISPLELSKNGFFYLKRLDHTQCCHCRLVVGKWEHGDIVAVEHRKYSPWCPFLNGLVEGNDEPRTGPEDFTYGYDTCQRKIRPNYHPEKSDKWKNTVPIGITKHK